MSPISAEKWKEYSAVAHLICFDEKRPPELERIDFALVAGENDTPAAYATIKELDSETAYMQYGGAFPSVRGTSGSLRSYRAIMDFLRMNYKRAGTLIENTNKPMLKFALNEGWQITGLRVFNGAILLEHKIEFGG